MGIAYNTERNGEYWNANIAEMIVFTEGITTQEQQKIESYLALKYGLQLDQTIAKSYISSSAINIWDHSLTDANTFNQSIAGIGRDDVSGLHQKQSTAQMEGLVTIGLNTITADQRFLTWAHNGGTLEISDTIEINDISIRRVTKTWQTQEVNGDVGNTQVSIDISNAEFQHTVPRAYVLLLATDADFPNGGTTIIVADSIKNDVVYFDDVNFQHQAYFTIAEKEDIIRPTVVISSHIDGPVNFTPIPIEVKFSEPVLNFGPEDLIVNGGSISHFTGSGALYSIHFNLEEEGITTVDIDSNVAIDVAENGNRAASQFQLEYDTTPPTVVITTTSSQLTNDNPIPVTFTFSEPVFAGDFSNVLLNGGTLSDFITLDSIFTFNVIPSGDGMITVDIHVPSVIDAANNLNTAAQPLIIEYDGTAPIVTIDKLTTQDQTPELTGTVDDNEAIVSLNVDGQIMEVLNNRNGTWTLANNILTSIDFGIYDISATATDKAMNMGGDTTTNELTIAMVTGLKKCRRC